jgi:hypothetical protein
MFECHNVKNLVNYRGPYFRKFNSSEVPKSIQPVGIVIALFVSMPSFLVGKVTDRMTAPMHSQQRDQK